MLSHNPDEIAAAIKASVQHLRPEWQVATALRKSYPDHGVFEPVITVHIHQAGIPDDYLYPFRVEALNLHHDLEGLVADIIEEVEDYFRMP